MTTSKELKASDLPCLISTMFQSQLPLLRDLLLLFLRLTIGWQFFVTGKTKLTDLVGTSEYFEMLGIPAPVFLAGVAGGVELVGGLLLIVGLLSRAAALPLAGIMAGAYLTAHRQDAFAGLAEFAGQPPFPFLVVSLVILVFGPGRAAVDQIGANRLCPGWQP